MILTAYRLTNKRYATSAFDGEGARLYGGRWNSAGTRMVYLASSRSLATLEILVHIEDVSVIEHDYTIIPVEFPRSIVTTLAPEDLPNDWAAAEPVAETQKFGDNWVRDKSSAILAVPSAVTNEEKNYLINPDHPDFSQLKIGDVMPFRFDPRLKSS